MAAITAIDARQNGSFAAAITTLSASDTITFDRRFKQLLVVTNPTGGSLTLKIDGADGTTVSKPGVGSVTVSGGYDIAIPAGESRAVVLASISDYCQGVVTLTGAATCTLQLFNF